MTHHATDLIYYPDSEPGITRRRCGRGFSYLAPDGTTIADRRERDRLAALAIPPAYDNVWMSPLSNGHLLATGHDARKRKQYRYHPTWTAAQAATKFDGLADFGRALPRIRRAARKLLTADAGDLDYALGSAVMLIDRFALRPGNTDYTRDNGSYGALTLRRKHVRLKDDRISLDYIAKGGKRVRKQMADRTLARLLHTLSHVPGAALLSWIDTAGHPQTLSSGTLNSFLSETAGQDGVTAKTFRTWAGTLAAYERAETGPATIKDMASAAATRLHNTPTIARNSYIHPAVIALAGETLDPTPAPSPSGLRAAERRLLAFLDSHA